MWEKKIKAFSCWWRCWEKLSVLYYSSDSCCNEVKLFKEDSAEKRTKKKGNVVVTSSGGAHGCTNGNWWEKKGGQKANWKMDNIHAHSLTCRESSTVDFTTLPSYNIGGLTRSRESDMYWQWPPYARHLKSFPSSRKVRPSVDFCCRQRWTTSSRKWFHVYVTCRPEMATSPDVTRILLKPSYTKTQLKWISPALSDNRRFSTKRSTWSTTKCIQTRNESQRVESTKTKAKNSNDEL